MKFAVVLLAAVATVHSSAINRSGRQGWGQPGWSTTTASPGWSTTTTTQGWSTPPPTTAGWSTPPPTTAGWSTTTSGWSTPPPTTAGWSTPGWSHNKGWGSSTPGWSIPSSLTNIELNSALAAAGSGWAAENHNENVQVTGGAGWGPSADIVISAGGESLVGQSGEILQVTDQDSQQASSVNTVSVSQIAEASEAEVVDASGIDISNEQAGAAVAAGEGSSAAAADSTIEVSRK